MGNDNLVTGILIGACLLLMVAIAFTALQFQDYSGGSSGASAGSTAVQSSGD